jgi:hypothetical protein
VRQHLKNTLENLDSDYQRNLNDKLERRVRSWLLTVGKSLQQNWSSVGSDG